MRTTLFLVAAAISIAGCPLHNPVPVEPDYPPWPTSSVEAACSSACTNLRRLDCPEGQGAISGETCERRCGVAMQLRSMPLACWTTASSAAEARGCGSLRCIR